LIFVGLGLSPYIGFDIAVLTLAAYMLLTVLAYVRTITASEFKLSYGKLGPTEIRVLAVLLNTAMFIFGDHFWRLTTSNFGVLTISPYDLFVGFICLLILYFFSTTAIREAVRLAKAEH
jgi:archaetidylinositol phosphate synthase